jgi:hypothetical protein
MGMAGVKFHVNTAVVTFKQSLKPGTRQSSSSFYFSVEGDSPNCYLYSLHGEKILPAAAFIYYI